MSTRNFTEANRAAWEEVAERHASHNQARLLAAFRDPGFSVLSEIEVAALEAIGIRGKDVAQVCCNNGRELISVKRLGADRCVGFDGAPSFIAQAQALAQAAGAACEFVCTDAYDIDPRYHGRFDIVVITIGVLSWMPDLPGFFQVIAALIRPGGAVFIYEQHPVLEMVKPAGPDDPVEWELSYFDKSPYVDNSGLDYYGGETYDAKPATSFLHTMAEIIMAGIDADLAIEHFEERPEHISNSWWNVEKQGPRLPMSYTLVFRKGP